jgi:hypothetical protein
MNGKVAGERTSGASIPMSVGLGRRRVAFLFHWWAGHPDREGGKE